MHLECFNSANLCFLVKIHSYLQGLIRSSRQEPLWLLILALFLKDLSFLKKKWRKYLTETIGAYESLGLIELRARAVQHQLKKRSVK